MVLVIDADGPCPCHSPPCRPCYLRDRYLERPLYWKLDAGAYIQIDMTTAAKKPENPPMRGEIEEPEVGKSFEESGNLGMPFVNVPITQQTEFLY
jgi:hypothetical protein